MKTLKQILSELSEIKKELQSIASNLESRNDSEVKVQIASSETFEIGNMQFSKLPNGNVRVTPLTSSLEQSQIPQPSKVGRLSTEIKLDTEEIARSIREFLAD